MALYRERIIDRIYDCDQSIDSITEEFKNHAKIINDVFGDPALLNSGITDAFPDEFEIPPPIGFIAAEEIRKEEKKKEAKAKKSSIERVRVKLSSICRKPDPPPKKKEEKKPKPACAAYVSCASVKQGNGDYHVEQRSAIHNEEGEEEYLVTKYDKDGSYAMRKHVYSDGYEEIQRDYRKKTNDNNYHFRDMCGIKWKD